VENFYSTPNIEEGAPRTNYWLRNFWSKDVIIQSKLKISKDKTTFSIGFGFVTMKVAPPTINASLIILACSSATSSSSFWRHTKVYSW
jgi:hypothetical protein